MLPEKPGVSAQKAKADAKKVANEEKVTKAINPKKDDSHYLPGSSPVIALHRIVGPDPRLDWMR